jgi:hypothetical protein
MYRVVYDQFWIRFFRTRYCEGWYEAELRYMEVMPGSKLAKASESFAIIAIL